MATAQPISPLRSRIDEIRSLSALSPSERDDDALIRLRDLRFEAGRLLVSDVSQLSDRPCPPPDAVDPFPDCKNDIPEADASDFTADMLAGAIRHHGALILRNFMDSDLAAELRGDIDCVIDRVESIKEPARNVLAKELPEDGHIVSDNSLGAWLSTFSTGKKKEALNCLHWVRSTGSIWTLLSPKVADRVLAHFERSGLKPLLHDYFGDEPCVSLYKSVLRRVEPLGKPAEWHQDGAFMSEQIKSVNLWLALSECGAGTTRPGMDIVPGRIDHVLEKTGQNGAIFDWSVSQATVDEEFAHRRPIRPHFNAGDAVLFDHYNLHTTSYDESFTENRYAIETWFFSSSCYAPNQAPVYW